MLISTMRRYEIVEPMFVAHDGFSVVEEQSSEVQSPVVLEHYYNDVYKLLLAELVNFDRASVVENGEAEHLQSLVNEVIKVKCLLTGTTPSKERK